jgi:hypothetical protein
MSITITNIAKQKFLENFFSVENLTLKLFSNDVTPSSTDDSDSFEEFSGGNYSSVELNSSEWNITSSDVFYPQINWSFENVSGNIYGYYIVDENDSVIFAERFPNAPYAVSNSGDEIAVSLNLIFL